MIRLDPTTAECRVLTFREGLFSRLGHDLVLRVTRFDIRIDDERRSVDASFDAASLRVVMALRGGVELPGAIGDADRKTIEDAIRRDVLECNTHPEIRFRSTRIADVDGGWDATGRLTLHGEEREIVVPLRREGDTYVGAVRLHQPDFGITPYSAFLGGLKVKPEVVVRVALPASPPQGSRA